MRRRSVTSIGEHGDEETYSGHGAGHGDAGAEQRPVGAPLEMLAHTLTECGLLLLAERQIANAAR